jgi:hypothetical protein
VDKLASTLEFTPLYAQTPSPEPTDLLSSSVENTPPKSIEALERNQKKISKKIATFEPKVQRDIAMLHNHHRIIYERLKMAEATVSRIRAAQEPLRRSITKRQVKPLSHTGILSVRDANRSIKTRKEKEAAAEQRKLAKQYKQATGLDMPQRPQEDIDRSIGSARLAQE